MTQKLTFHVIYATSEDSAYPACELNVHGPQARGWRSAGAAPHELLLRLDRAAAVARLQLLAHHQLIPAWVEVLISGGLTAAGGEATPCGAAYASVGRVHLAQPAHDPRTRELRSAALPEPPEGRAEVRFVKLRISGPHGAPPGDTQQVSLMAVNLIGYEREASPRASPPAPPAPGGAPCPYDDLAFVMYVDTEIADIIRLLDTRKKCAVAEERFEYARRLKSAGAALAVVGARVGRWRLRKRSAAALEDFELASQMRNRIAAAINGIRSDPEISRLYEEDARDARNDEPILHPLDLSRYLLPPARGAPEEPSPVPIDPDRDPSRDDDVLETAEDAAPIQHEEIMQVQEIYVHQERLEIRTEEVPVKQKSEEELLRTETDSPRRSVTPNSANGVRRRNKSAGPRTTFEAYEERPLPALRHSQTNEYLRESAADDAGSGCAAPARAHKLNERERKHAALPILIFGYPLVEKFYSKNYFDKEDGLCRLKSELQAPSGGNRSSPNKCARAAATLLQRSLRDKVFSVYCQANELVRTLFQEFMRDNKVCAAEVARCADKLLPELLRASGDPAPRVHSTAQHTVLSLADCPHVRALHVIPQQLVRPAAAAMHPRLALSRLQMLEQLLITHGISTDKNSGLTVRRLAECGAAGAQHASGAVRAAAERILLAAYRRSPRVVRAQLPPDDAVTRRNLLYRHLFQQLDRIDTEKLLSAAPSEDQLTDSSLHSALETASATSTRSGTTSGVTSSFGMTSSFGLSTSSLKSAASGSTLAPSLGSGKSSLKRAPRKYGQVKCREPSIGYNKLRLDSAVSPKHSPKTPNSVEKVHFEDTDEVVFRKANRNTENRHSMIHFDHETPRPPTRERPATVYEPLHVEYQDSPAALSPKPKHDQRADSIDSYRSSDADITRLDSPKAKEFFRELDSPRMVAGVKSLHLDECQMDESGYYSPVERGGGGRPRRSVPDFGEFDSYDRPMDSSGGNTPEPVCNTACSWCGVRVRAGAMEAHCARRCVLLARCTHCALSLEARGLHRHLLEECAAAAAAGAWKACRECGAALRAQDPDYHPNCHPLRLDEWKCPYCLHNVLARDLPWQRHLMQCPRNPRVAPL